MPIYYKSKKVLALLIRNTGHNLAQYFHLRKAHILLHLPISYIKSFHKYSA